MSFWIKYLVFLCGLAALVRGAELIYRPLGWIVGGLLLIVFALLIDKLADHGSR